jgi:hypothetical protein
MSTSTDALLVYGYVWDDEHASAGCIRPPR